MTYSATAAAKLFVSNGKIRPVLDHSAATTARPMRVVRWGRNFVPAPVQIG